MLRWGGAVAGMGSAAANGSAAATAVHCVCAPAVKRLNNAHMKSHRTWHCGPWGGGDSAIQTAQRHHWRAEASPKYHTSPVWATDGFETHHHHHTVITLCTATNCGSATIVFSLWYLRLSPPTPRAETHVLVGCAGWNRWCRRARAGGGARSDFLQPAHPCHWCS